MAIPRDKRKVIVVNDITYHYCRINTMGGGVYIINTKTGDDGTFQVPHNEDFRAILPHQIEKVIKENGI